MSNIKILSFKKKDEKIKEEIVKDIILFDQLDINTDDLYIPYPEYKKIEKFLFLYPSLKYIHKHVTFIPLGNIKY